MSERELQRLLNDLGEGFDPSTTNLARTAWSRAGSARRRQRVVAGGGALILLAGVPAAFALQPVASSEVAGALGASPHEERVPVSSFGDVRIHHAPPVAGEARLPLAETPYRRLTDVTVDAAPLSASPARRILAATQGDLEEPILLLTEDGAWRTVDVDSRWTSDEGGNRAPALKPTSISPDRTTLAIPQRDALVLVHAPTGTSRRIAAPGFNEQVRWSGDGREVMVGGSARSFVVDIASETVAAAAYRAWDVVALESQGATELGNEGIRSVDGRGRQMSGRVPSGLISNWWGDGWERSGRTARAAFGSPAQTVMEQGVAILDHGSGQVSDFLSLPMSDGRNKGCCRVLGWQGDSTVLIGHTGTRILAWDHVKGSLQRVAEVRAQVVALAPAP